MNDMSENPRIVLGANNPPATRADELALKYDTYVSLANEVLAAAKTAPLRVDDDEEAGKIAELAKKMRSIEDSLEDAYSGEKAPHNLAIAQLSGFFKNLIEPLQKERKRIAVVAKDYSDRKKVEAQRKKQEEADRKRLEAEKKEREARDAAQTAGAARASLAEFQRLEQEALQAKASASSEQELAAAQVAACEAELARAKADKAALLAEFARRVTEGNPVSAEDKARQEDEANAKQNKAKGDLETARNLLTEARERARVAREAARRAEDEAAAKAAQLRSAERDVKSATTEAVKLAGQADRIEEQAKKDDPKDGSVRSLHGAVATTMTVWRYELDDRALVDIEALRPFFRDEDYRVALGKWMDTQAEEHRHMPGARFWTEVVPVIR